MKYEKFWVIALASNAAASAQNTAIIWSISSPDLTVAAIIAWQILGVLAVIVGAQISARLSARFDTRNVILASTALQMASCVGVSVLAPFDSAVTNTTVFGVVLVDTLQSLGWGIGGAAWVMMVAKWPGTGSPTSQLLKDSAQFQIGYSAGPVIAALAISMTTNAILITSLASLGAYALVVFAILSARVKKSVTSTVLSPHSIGVHRRRPAGLLRSLFVLTTALAVTVDPARAFLARLMQADDYGEWEYGVIATLIAATSAVLARVQSRSRASQEQLVKFGFLALATAMSFWALTVTVGEGSGLVLWLLGAPLVGVATSLIPAAVNSLVMKNESQESARRDLSHLTAVRSLMGGVGSLALGISVAGGALIAIGPLALIAALGWIFSHALQKYSGEDDDKT